MFYLMVQVMGDEHGFEDVKRALEKALEIHLIGDGLAENMAEYSITDPDSDDDISTNQGF